MSVSAIAGAVGEFLGVPKSPLAAIGLYVKFMYTRCRDKFDNDEAYRQQLFENAMDTNCD